MGLICCCISSGAFAQQQPPQQQPPQQQPPQQQPPQQPPQQQPLQQQPLQQQPLQQQHLADSQSQAGSSLIAGITGTAVKAELIRLYNRQAGVQSGLYLGTQYEPYINVLKEGFVFYNSPEWQQGSVLYNAISYTGLSLKYDLLQDKLITPYYTPVIELELFAENVQAFSLGTRNFINYQPDSASAASMPAGFYEVLYNGLSKVLVKRVKLILEKIENTVIERSTYSSDRYFVWHERAWHEFDSENSLVRQSGMNKSDARDALKSSQLNYKNNPEQAIIAILTRADKTPTK